MNIVGKRLRAYRKFIGYSQEEMAAANMIRLDEYRKWEEGEELDLSQIQDIAVWVNLSPSYLMGQIHIPLPPCLNVKGSELHSVLINKSLEESLEIAGQKFLEVWGQEVDVDD